MKNLIYTLTFLLLIFFSCKESTTTYLEQGNLKVNIALGDRTVNEGVVQIPIDLTNVFKVEGSANATIFKSIYSIQNPELIQASVSGNSLYLQIAVGNIGSCEIGIRGEYEGEVEYDVFTVTVIEISADLALNKAIQYFQNMMYDSSEIYFNVLVSKNHSSYQSDAYMGLGFSQMRLEKTGDSYISLKSSLLSNSQNNDAKAGLSLLEYAYKRNYLEAIRYGREVLTANNNYIFKYDSSLDKFDMLMNIALSQYSLQLFTDCLTTVQTIDPAFLLDLNDLEFEIKLFQKLEVLIQLYS